MKIDLKTGRITSMKRIYLISTIVFTVFFLLTSSSYTKVIASQNEVNKNPLASTTNVFSIQEDASNKLGLIYSVKKLEEASVLVKDGKLNEAEKILLDTKNWLTESSDYHYNLFEVLKKQPKTISTSKIEKAHALDFAKARDQAYFLLAKVYIIQNKYREAVNLLVDVIKSQPNSDLSNQAYRLLQQIKFSDKPN